MLRPCWEQTASAPKEEATSQGLPLSTSSSLAVQPSHRSKQQVSTLLAKYTCPPALRCSPARVAALHYRRGRHGGRCLPTPTPLTPHCRQLTQISSEHRAAGSAQVNHSPPHPGTQCTASGCPGCRRIAGRAVFLLAACHRDCYNPFLGEERG